MQATGWPVENTYRPESTRPGDMAQTTRPTDPRFQALMDAAVDAIVVSNHEGIIETFNRAAEQIFGYSQEEVVGRNVALLMPDSYAREHDRYIRNYQTTNVPRIIGMGREVTARHKSGRIFPAELSVGEATSEGKHRFVGIIRDISERKTIEKALLRERDRAQNYLDLADVILLGLDNRGRVSLVNRRGCEVLGYQESELLGKDWISTCIPEESRELVQRTFTRMMAGEEPWHQITEHTVLNRFGARRLIAWRNTIVRDERGAVSGTLSSGDDVTIKRQTENQLRLREEELNLIFENAPLGTFTLDLGGRVLTLNSALCRTLEATQDEILGSVFIDSVHKEDKARIRKLLAGLAAGQSSPTPSLRCRMHSYNGRLLHVELSAGAVHDASDRPAFLIIQVQDLSDRVNSEEEARHLRERLAHVGRLSTLGEMTAGIAHEINQPLTAISTYAQAGKRFLAMDDVSTSDLQDTLELIDNQAQRAAEVIRSLRRLVRRKAAKREQLNCNQLVRDVVQLAELDMRDQDVEIHLDLLPDLPDVSADSVQVQQVVLNLIRNALEALKDNESAGKITIRSTTQGPEWIRISVEDTGPGVSEEMLDNVFSPFRSSKESGMGLGLSISRSIVNAHGGELRFENNPEGGASFYFTLPSAVTRD